ncbi:MAG TPA: type II toxin-antitoxin system HicB family antitoxin [Vicinamibacterales bacterium]|nr:type II toxin-antitoxin system HicB family antitoxin [Vicinamibacterales bacterium]
MTYTAVYERDLNDGRWLVEIPAVPGCHSYGRTIEQARDRIREALGLYVPNAERATIEDDVRLTAAALEAVSLALALRSEIEEMQARVPAVQRRAIARLRRMKLGHRDVGEILGLSFQRIHQIAKRKAG